MLKQVSFKEVGHSAIGRGIERLIPTSIMVYFQLSKMKIVLDWFPNWCSDSNPLKLASDRLATFRPPLDGAKSAFLLIWTSVSEFVTAEKNKILFYSPVSDVYSFIFDQLII